MNTNNTLVVTGTENINAFRGLALRRGLMLEMKGLKMSRGPSAFSVIKSEFGLKGNKEKVLAAFTQLLKDQSILVDE